MMTFRILTKYKIGVYINGPCC